MSRTGLDALANGLGVARTLAGLDACTSGASPQAALLCGLQYDADNCLVSLDGPAA